MTKDQHGARRGATVLKRLPFDPVAWDAIVERYPDAEVFHSSAWLAFLAASQGAEPVVAVVNEGDRPVGHFVGAIVRRYGVRILGSPLRGWGTERMGFLLEDGADRRAAADSLVPFAFHDLRLSPCRARGRAPDGRGDGRLRLPDRDRQHVRRRPGAVRGGDLRPDEAEDATVHPPGRSAEELHAEIASDLAFADEFHEQLRDVFGRQGLVPTYGIERVRQLIRTRPAVGSAAAAARAVAGRGDRGHRHRRGTKSDGRELGCCLLPQGR